VGQCMVFEGSNIGSVWDNNMYNSTDGLVLKNQGVIGPQTGFNPTLQIPSENFWYGPFVHSQTLVDVSSPSSASILYVRNTPLTRPTLNLGPATTVYSFATIFQVTGTSTRDCNTPAIVENNNGDDTKELLTQIVQDSVNMGGNFVDEANWQSKQQVFLMLKEDSSLLIGAQELQQFYVETPLTGIGKVTSTDEQLSQTNTSSAALDNQSITPEVQPEQNYKDVNDIYISLLDGNAIDSLQYQMLESIAMQCPQQGGIAVYRARALLEVIDDNIRQWDDNCSSSSRLASGSPSENSSGQTPDVFLYPNPNDGNMTLSYILPEHQQGKLVVYDLMGNVVSTTTLASGSQQQSINLSQLSSGVYYYQVTYGDMIIKNDKIIIVK